MADDADIAGSDTASNNLMFADKLAAIRFQAASIPEGKKGKCKECGEYFTRLVKGHCGRCRDLLKLP